MATSEHTVKIGINVEPTPAARSALLALGWTPPGGPATPAETEWDRARDAWEAVRRDEWDQATPKTRMAITALGTLIGIHDGHGEES